jgi:ribulose-5-phosphate 4-epimerase/fuculose-1-phosphate aldolase
MSTDAKLRENICRLGASLFGRGLTSGASGNISTAHPDGGWLMTPTNVALDELDPARLSRLDTDGQLLSGDKATKEAALHMQMYRHRETAGAVIHLHSTHSVAVSCMHGIDPHDCLPPLTPYYVMRVGRLPLAPYHPPGDPELADIVGELASRHHAILLANHGPVVAGTDLRTAQGAIEELEETAKLFLLLRGSATRPLSADEVEELRQRFG